MSSSNPLPGSGVGPLWPLTLILAEIAARVARRAREEQPETEVAAGDDPAATEGAA